MNDSSPPSSGPPNDPSQSICFNAALGLSVPAASAGNGTTQSQPAPATNAGNTVPVDPTLEQMADAVLSTATPTHRSAVGPSNGMTAAPTHSQDRGLLLSPARIVPAALRSAATGPSVIRGLPSRPASQSSPANRVLAPSPRGRDAAPATPLDPISCSSSFTSGLAANVGINGNGVMNATSASSPVVSSGLRFSSPDPFVGPSHHTTKNKNENLFVLGSSFFSSSSALAGPLFSPASTLSGSAAATVGSSLTGFASSPPASLSFDFTASGTFPGSATTGFAAISSAAGLGSATAATCGISSRAMVLSSAPDHSAVSRLGLGSGATFGSSAAGSPAGPSTLATPATDEDDNNSDHNNEKMESGDDEADEVNEMNNNIKIDKGKGKAVDYGDINDDANSNSSLEMSNAAAVPHQINIPEDKMYDWEANPISAFWIRNNPHPSPHQSLSLKDFYSGLIPPFPTDPALPFAPWRVHDLPPFRPEPIHRAVQVPLRFLASIGQLYPRAVFAVSRLPIHALTQSPQVMSGEMLAKSALMHFAVGGATAGLDAFATEWDHAVYGVVLLRRDWPTGGVAALPNDNGTTQFFEGVKSAFGVLPFGLEKWNYLVHRETMWDGTVRWGVLVCRGYEGVQGPQSNAVLRRWCEEKAHGFGANLQAKRVLEHMFGVVPTFGMVMQDLGGKQDSEGGKKGVERKRNGE